MRLLTAIAVALVLACNPLASEQDTLYLTMEGRNEASESVELMVYVERQAYWNPTLAPDSADSIGPTSLPPDVDVTVRALYGDSFPREDRPARERRFTVEGGGRDTVTVTAYDDSLGVNP